jgi:hypothetical protein
MTADPITAASLALIEACQTRQAEISNILGEVRNDSQGPLFTEYQTLSKAVTGAQRAIRSQAAR